MPRSCRALFALFSLTAALVGQDARPSVRAMIEKENRIIALQWRRDATGNLEYAVAGEKDAPFAALFAKGLVDGLAVTGIAGRLALLAHHGDVLSLTDGDAHLRRLAITTTPAELVQFVRSPLPAQLADLALLDRLVAIDLLARNSDKAAKESLAALAADATLTAPLRVRATAAPAKRAKLDPTTLPLPAQADVIVLLAHERLFDAHWLVELSHFTGLVSSAQVIQMLRAPRTSDFVLGQTESEMITELPFELARQFGNYRLDHTCLAIRLPAAEDAATEWAIASAGHFDPAATVQGWARQPSEGATARLLEQTASLSWRGAEAVVTATLATAHATSFPVEPRPELAAHLLQPTGAAARIHVPSGSRLLLELESEGIAGIQTIDATVALDDPIVFEATLKAKDAAAASRMAKQVKNQFLRLGGVGLLLRLTVELDDESILLVEAAEDEVHIRLPIARTQLMHMDKARRRMLKDVR